MIEVPTGSSLGGRVAGNGTRLMRVFAIWLGAVLVVAAVHAADTSAGATEDATDQRIARLIEQLGDTQFLVRQRAQAELVKLGFDAFDALTEAETSDDPEIAMQAGYLVRQIRSRWTTDDDPRSVQQIFKDYESLDDERRLVRIKQLAELGDEGLEWLCRLVRFEKSPVLAKHAALAIIGQKVSSEAEQARRIAVITRSMHRAKRLPAQWLMAYVRSLSDPAGALEKWSALVETERQTLDVHPQDTHNQIVMELLRRKIELLDRLGRGDEAPEVLHQMVLCERGDSASLIELVEWIAKRKAWSALDEVTTRFSASFEVDAMLTYTLCEARLEQGDRAAAQALAQAALKLNGDSPAEHIKIAQRLADRGLLEWADREWRQVLTLAPLGSPDDVEARVQLAARFHDIEHDNEAAELFKTLLDAADKDTTIMQRLRAQPPGEGSANSLRATMLFYAACHAARENNPKLQRELLDKGLSFDRMNVEVLIALYPLTEKDEEKRAEVMKAVREYIDVARGKADEAPEESAFYNVYVSQQYNQIAWLVANTEGDIDEAIRMSQKSIELARAAGDGKRVGGLLDTLGHCYFAKRDYANAVKYQTQAAELDLHTAAIRRQLKVFRAALAKEQQQAK